MLRWFNSAISIHWFLPIVLVLIGYPIGVYIIENWLVIPPDRIQSSIWVFRLSLLVAFMNMVSVPYVAMYQAKQLIAELSIWGVVSTLANFAIAYYMLYCTYDRFIMYACLSSMLPSLILWIQVHRARKQFGVCHLRIKYLFDKSRLAKIFNYAFWDFFGWFGGIVRDQGSVFVLNRYYGAGLNAAYRIAQSVIGYTSSLSTSIVSALQPAITTAIGQGKKSDAISLAFKASKFSPLMILFFAIPVFVEINELLRLWLINPPEYSAEFCRTILVATVIQKLGWGHHMAICAFGRIAKMQLVLGLTACASLLILIGLIVFGGGPISVGYMMIIVFLIMTIERVAFARKLIGMSTQYWFFQIVVPILFVILITGCAAYGFSSHFEVSFWRVCGTSVVATVCMSVLSWFLILNTDEKKFMKEGLFKRLK